jgi:hypothetical protein
MDLSYRKVGAKGKPNGREHVKELIRFLVANNEELGIEMILDYFPTPHGRGWRCDRQSWTRYSKATITGAPGGDWIHVEISPTMADSSQAVKTAFARLNQV